MQINQRNPTQSDNTDQIQDGIQDIIQFQKILRACSPPSIDGKDNFTGEFQTEEDFKKSLTKKDIQNIKVLIQNGLSGKNSDLGLTHQQTLKLESMLTMNGEGGPLKLNNWARGQTQIIDENAKGDQILDQSPDKKERLHTQTGQESPNQFQTFEKSEKNGSPTTQDKDQKGIVG